MNREQVKDFTRRISQCNRGGMIVVIYDIFFAYVTEAEDAFSRKENEQFQESVRKAEKCIDELMRAYLLCMSLPKNLWQSQ